MDSKDGHDEEEQSFLSGSEELESSHVRQEAPRRSPWWYLRLLLEAAMAVSIVVLMIQPPLAPCRLKPSPVPTFPRKTYTFVENKRYLNEDMWQSNHSTLLTLHNWVELTAAARGYVQIPDAKSYGLGEPYNVSIDRHNEGPAYMVSVFHQLHCLSYLVEHFQMGFAGNNLTQEIAHHSSHCFDYIRQGIMCSADTSLEGTTEAGPGWGSEHECTDYDALLAWANEHGAMAWRDSLIPPESDII